MPSGWWDSDCLCLTAWSLVQSHSLEKWDESFQGCRGRGNTTVKELFPLKEDVQVVIE